jgi:hypothetical protein
MAKQRGSEEKVREYLWRGAEAYDRCGHLESAEEQLDDLLECELSKEQKLEALCFLADVQARGRGGGRGGRGGRPARALQSAAALEAPCACRLCAGVLLLWGECRGGRGAGAAVLGPAEQAGAGDAPRPAQAWAGRRCRGSQRDWRPSRVTPGPAALGSA